MIGFLRGVVVEKFPDRLLLDVSGIGYELFCSTSSLSGLNKNETAMMHTYMHVREDVLQLFGFKDKKEKALFEKLIGVSKIGPKGALSILSGFSADQLINLITCRDVDAISQVPGIGKKTAERIVLELGEKLSAVASDAGSVLNDNLENRILNEARDALITLGYSFAEAANALKDYQGNGEQSVEQLLKHAFSALGRK
jgi:Holliday junction DNA helicase RuvA